MATPLWHKIIRAFLCPDEVLHIFYFGSDADRWQGFQHSFMVSLSGCGTVVQDADHAGVGLRADGTAKPLAEFYLHIGYHHSFNVILQGGVLLPFRFAQWIRDGERQSHNDQR